ncbi:MAG: gliding motility-associated ABC transporter permease subunit GldF [Bernardetiaceae bacterium]
MRQIFWKEFLGFLYSPVGYVVLGLFLIGTWLFVWVFPQTNLLELGVADLDTFFSLTPYVFLFLIPGITMRSLADEQRSGTLDLLLTHPPSVAWVLWAKYLAAWALVALALLPTLTYVWTIYGLGVPVGNLDVGATTGAYLGLLLLGGVFVAVGIFASSLTESQIGAFVGALFLCFFLYEGLSSLARLSFWGETGYILEEVSLAYHYRSLGRGVIDSRDVLYFLGIIFFFLMGTRAVMSRRQW